MKNKHAQALKAAADKYLKGYNDMGKHIHTDYEDLISIAGMIENGEKPQSIAKAMWDLDTAVRDEIPDVVYNFYNK